MEVDITQNELMGILRKVFGKDLEYIELHYSDYQGNKDKIVLSKISAEADNRLKS